MKKIKKKLFWTILSVALGLIIYTVYPLLLDHRVDGIDISHHNAALANILS